MPFFAPLMLLGLVAASAPIILHLIRKRTAEHLFWGAWIFLAESMRRRHRKLQIEEILLLVMRTAMLALAAIAFARPFLPEMHLLGGRGMDKDVVLVIDTSASMRLKGADGRSAFEQAIAEACELVKLSPSGTAFGIVLGEQVPVIVTPTPLSSRREVLDLLAELKPGADTMDAPRSLAAAGEVLSSGNNPAKEVVVFGDGQSYGWKVADTLEWKRVESVFSRFFRRPPVVWRAFSRPENVKNAAIAGVIPSRRIIGTDRPVRFTVTVVNSGSTTFSPGDALMTIDGAEVARLPVGQMLPGLSRTFEFRHGFKTNGLHTVVTSLTVADDIASDSVVTNTVNVIDSLPVMVVNALTAETGFKRPSAFIEAALRPELKGTNTMFLVEPKLVRSLDLENEKVFKDKQAMILCDVPALSAKAMTNLVRYVEAGGGLLAVPGEHSHTEFYTNALFAVAMTNWNPHLKNVKIEAAPISGRIEIPEASLTNGFEVLKRFSDSAAAVVSRRYGKGITATSALPFDLNWTTFPARADFVPFIHELVYSLAATNSTEMTVDVRWRAHEGNLNPLTQEESEALAVYIDLGYARSRDDVVAAVVGKSFGVEIWRPFAIIALLLLIGEMLLCRRLDGERGGLVKSRYRFALRTLALLAIGWMLLHISWSHDEKRKIHRRVALFTDASLSMQRADIDERGVTNSVTRYATATNCLKALAAQLQGDYDLEPFAFGGNTTDFTLALEEALNRIPSEELAGAVLVTDGRDTGAEPPEAAARRFARLGAKVSTVLVGSLSNRTDVAIEQIQAARDVFLGDRVRIAAQLRADGMLKKRVAVKLMEGDLEVERREFEIDRDPWSREVRFVHDPVEKGLKNYRVELDRVDGDLEPRNDMWPVEVSVSDDRINVLLADRRPRWEFRYLRNLLYARDKSVHLQYVLTEPDRFVGAMAPAAPMADATRPFGEAEAGRLPAKRDDWRKFDVLVIGDVAREQLTDEVCEDIRYCVEERGALLVVVAGRESMPYQYLKSPLAKMLPLAFTNAAGKCTAVWNDRPGPFALSPSGAGHPVTMVAQSASENERIWNSLPPVRGRLEGGKLQPGAEVLVFAGDTTALSAPLITVRELGRGKVMMLSTDETWHLRYRRGDVSHHRFWSNTLKWGTGERLRDGNLFARSGTDKLRYDPGEPVKLIARFADREHLPIDAAKVFACVKYPGGKTRKLEMVKREGINGYYEAEFDDTALEGDYEVLLEAEEVKRLLAQEWPKSLKTVFHVNRGSAPVEFTHLTAERKVVDELARLTGGKVVEAGKLKKDFKRAFGASRGEIVEHVEDAIWDHPLALAIFCVALILCWIARKRKGLA